MLKIQGHKEIRNGKVPQKHLSTKSHKRSKFKFVGFRVLELLLQKKKTKYKKRLFNNYLFRFY